jgi:TonB family protein
VPSTINDCSEDVRVGQMLGRYELLMPIAKGGMGNVWAARLKGTRGFRKLVAVKTILRASENAHLEQMLFQEAMLASQIHHPNVAETFELGEHEGTLYLVMELVAGESLRFMMREAQGHGGIPLAVCVNLVGQVCRGLAAAHDLRDEDGQRVGLVHRDISPPNVLVTDAGTVKIVDFGVATTTSSATYGSGEIKGKISYLAPEQLRGEPLDARVDVFATGILLYLLTVGRHPFRCASESATIARILSDAPAAAPSAFVESYPRDLEQVVMRALDKVRETRFASITELLEALENAYPCAFGPRADEMVSSYVQKLTKDRLQERRSALRIAEEWAETSSSRHSVSSLPAVAASSASSAKPSRAALFGLGGVLTGLAVAAMAATIYFRTQAAAPGVTAGAPLPIADQSGPNQVPAAARPVPQQVADLSRPSSAVRAPESAAPEAGTESARRERADVADRARPSTSEKDERKRDSAVEPAESAAVTEPGSENAADVPALPVTTDEAPVPTPRVVAASLPFPVLTAQPLAPDPARPRRLASKVGHRQLLTNPSSKAVRVPAALQRRGQTFSATVNICVGPRGEVATVDILRSAGPALDPQIVELLSHWRYRPLMEGGRATPFCYPMKYQVESE